MTQDSRPWDGQATLGDDGAYSAAEWIETWGNMWGNDFLAASGGNNRGVLKGNMNELRVVAESPASGNVTLQTGAALVKGRWYENDANLTLTPAANAAGSTRYDIVVLYANSALQTIRAQLVQGTAGAGLPTLTQSGNDWMIPIAYIELTNGFSTISQANIYDMRSFGNMPLLQAVTVFNNGGADLDAGDICIWDGSADRAVTDTTYVGQNIAGVVVGRIETGDWGQIVTKGEAWVRVATAVSRNDLLSAFSTANVSGNCGGVRFARALQSGSADDMVLAAVDVQHYVGDWHEPQETFLAAAPDNAILLYGQTIGDTGSGADVADTETQALYTYFWDNLADTQAPVSSGRGASAVADFAAGKTLTVPDVRGRTFIGKDNMGGSSAGVVTASEADTVGDVEGEENHTLTTAEMAAHTHTYDKTTSAGVSVTLSGTAIEQVTGFASTATSSAGSDNAHNNMQPYMTVQVYARL